MFFSENIGHLDNKYIKNYIWLLDSVLIITYINIAK